MVFEFDSSLLAGETIVCFEKVYHNGIEVACHEDLSDEDQSTFILKLKQQLMMVLAELSITMVQRIS